MQENICTISSIVMFASLIIAIVSMVIGAQIFLAATGITALLGFLTCIICSLLPERLFIRKVKETIDE